MDFTLVSMDGAIYHRIDARGDAAQAVEKTRLRDANYADAKWPARGAREMQEDLNLLSWGYEEVCRVCSK